MKFLYGFALYVLIGYFVLIGLTYRGGGMYEGNPRMAFAIALTWPVYALKYVVLAIWYVLTLIYTGVVHAL